MINRKITPYFFLLVLFLIIVFIIGIKYGKKIEQSDKRIHYLVNIKPSPTVTPILEPTITYITFIHEDCGISFLYPSYLEKISQSSDSAQIGGNFSNIAINCSKTTAISPTDTEKIATQSLTLQNKKIIATKKQISEGKIDMDVLFFTVKNSNNNTNVSISIDSRLYPLFEKSFSFNPL